MLPTYYKHQQAKMQQAQMPDQSEYRSQPAPQMMKIQKPIVVTQTGHLVKAKKQQS